VVSTERCRCFVRKEVRPPPWYGSDGTMCIVAKSVCVGVTRFFGSAHLGLEKPGTPVQARVVVLRPVTVEVKTTSTAATAIAMSQRTQSIPGLPFPPKAV
jgi:hypothetical protein